jgi:hypothetical protein
MEKRQKELSQEPNTLWQSFKLSAGNPLGTSNYLSDMIPASSCYRIRKQSKREIKAWEKEDKRKRSEIEERKKRKVNDYHKTLMDHRDSFLKFHKGVRSGTVSPLLFLTLFCSHFLLLSSLVLSHFVNFYSSLLLPSILGIAFIECSKVAKLVRLWVENADAKRERDEARIEMKRIQALKENDMEAYTSLVQETKKGRFKFLLK